LLNFCCVKSLLSVNVKGHQGKNKYLTQYIIAVDNEEILDYC